MATTITRINVIGGVDYVVDVTVEGGAAVATSYEAGQWCSTIRRQTVEQAQYDAWYGVGVRSRQAAVRR